MTATGWVVLVLALLAIGFIAESRVGRWIGAFFDWLTDFVVGLILLALLIGFLL